MKLETTARQLRDALKLVARAIERRTTYPVLSCVLIDGPTLRGTNLDIEICARVAASEAHGRAAIDFRRLRDLAGALPLDGTVTIAAGKDCATLSFAGGRYDLPTLDPDAYPSMPKSDDAERTALEGTLFDAALKFVAPTICREETRYYLNGFCFSRGIDEAPMLVTTDGHRLSAHPFVSADTWMEGKIVPTVAVRALLVMPGAGAMVRYAGKELVRFEWPGVTLITKLIEGTFPDWKRVLPKTTDVSPSIVVDRDELLGKLRRLVLARGKGAPFVALAVDDRRGVLGFKHPNDGEGREYLTTVRGTNVGAQTVIGFRADYLRDLLRVFADDEIAIVSSGDGGPMYVRPLKPGAFTVLMPARADDTVASQALQELVQRGAAA